VIQEHEEPELRARFAALREVRDAAVPPLNRLLAAAETRRRVARAAARRRLLYTCAATIPLSGAFTAYALDRAAARERARLIADAQVLANWRSPTGYLLADASLAWLSTGPALESIIDVPASDTTGGRP
jgi:hypothetical protein